MQRFFFPYDRVSSEEHCPDSGVFQHKYKWLQGCGNNKASSDHKQSFTLFKWGIPTVEMIWLWNQWTSPTLGTLPDLLSFLTNADQHLQK